MSNVYRDTGLPSLSNMPTIKLGCDVNIYVNVHVLCMYVCVCAVICLHAGVRHIFQSVISVI